MSNLAETEDTPVIKSLQNVACRIICGFTKNTAARDRKGRPMYRPNVNSWSWSLWGSFIAEQSKPGFAQALALVKQLLVRRGVTAHFGKWSDRPSRKKREVLQLLDEAIALAKGERVSAEVAT